MRVFTSMARSRLTFANKLGPIGQKVNTLWWLPLALVFVASAVLIGPENLVGADSALPVQVSRASSWSDRGFTPDRDGLDETIGSYYCLSKTASVSITVVPEAGGSPVRTLSTSAVKTASPADDSCNWSSDKRWEWDGRNNIGFMAADGRYKVVVSALDAQSNTDQVEFLTEVDTAAIGVVESPIPGSTDWGEIEVRFAPGEGRDVLEVYFEELTDGRWSKTVTEAGPDGKWRATWNTADTPDGERRLMVRVIGADSFGQTRVRYTYTYFQLDNASTEPLVVTRSPEWWGRSFRGDSIGSYYCLSGRASVTIAVVPEAGGEPVRTLMTGERKSASPRGACNSSPDKTWTWDTKTDAGDPAPDGRYNVVVSALDDRGNTEHVSFLMELDIGPVGVFDTPVAGSTISGTVAVRFTPAPGKTVKSVNFSELTQDRLTRSWGESNPDGSWSYQWNTNYTSDGERLLQIQTEVMDSFRVHSWRYVVVSVTLDNSANPPVVVSRPWAWKDRGFTPDGTGNDASISSQYCLSQPAEVTVTVRPEGGGDPIRTLVAGEFKYATPGTDCRSSHHSWLWDGKTDGGVVAPDGRYDVVVSALDGSGRTDQAVFRTEVDGSPVGVLESPVADSTVSGTVEVRAALTPGRDVQSVFVYSGSGSGAISNETDEPGPDGKWRFQWDTTKFVDGPGKIYVRIGDQDSFGNTRYRYLSAPLQIDNASVRAVIVTRDAEWSDRSMSLDGDGSLNTIRSAYCLSEPAHVTVTVVPESGVGPVRTLANAELKHATHPSHVCSGTTGSKWEWDGKTDSGPVAPDGRYKVVVSALDAQGDTGEAVFLTEIDTAGAGVVESPVATSTVFGSIELRFAPAAGRDITKMVVRETTEGFVTARAFAPDPDGKWRIQWDTRNLSDGARNLRFEISFKDSFGDTIVREIDVPIVVDNTTRAPVVVSRYLEWSDHGFTPDGDNHEETIGSYYCLSKTADVTITVAPKAGGDPVRTLTTAEPKAASAEGQCGFSLDKNWNWDGKTDSGELAADGRYNVTVSALDTHDNTAQVVFQTEVDTSPLGAITQPASGDTITGNAGLGFKPAPGSRLQRIDFCFPSRCVTGSKVGPDGQWRSSILTGLLDAGPDVLTAKAFVRDSFGVDHERNAPPSVDLVVDNTSIPLAVAVTPKTGLAPLDVSLAVITSDPNAIDLAYSIDWGDGTTAKTGTIPNPYAELTVAHTYENPGEFQPRVNISNGQGGESEESAPVVTVAKPNSAPIATLSAAPDSGHAPLPVTFETTASDIDGDSLTYTLDFGDGSSLVTGVGAPPATVTHTYAGAGIYYGRLAVSDGAATVARVTKITVGLSEPLSADAGDDRSVTTNEQVIFDGSNSRPTVGITSYEWKFGDGKSATGARSTHKYTAAGTYTAQLTVRSGTESMTDTTTVTVNKPTPEPGLHVNVKTGSSPLAGAETIVVRPDGTRISAVTGTNGQAILNGLPDGVVTVYVWGDGYQPKSVQATLEDGSGSIDVDLVSGQIGVSTLEVRRLTPEEIIEKGIDVDDPQNANVFEADINISVYDEPVKPMEILIVSSKVTCKNCGGGGGGDFVMNEHKFMPKVQYVDGQPIIQWLVVPVRASWLKEFFDVKMIVQNLTGGFVFERGVAQLNLPTGLSLAPTATAQTATVNVADIPASGSREITWTVRGDVEGDYDFSATYSGMVEPVGKPIFLEALTPEPLKVWGGSALKMTVEADDKIHRWGPYEVWVTLENVTTSFGGQGVDVYNAEIEVKERPSDAPGGQAEYFFTPMTQHVKGTPVIRAGEKFTAKYTLMAGVGKEELENLQLVLKKSFISRTGGNVDVETELLPKTAELYVPFDNLAVDVIRSESRGGDVARPIWMTPGTPVGKTITGYRVFTRNTTGTETWRPYKQVAEVGNGINHVDVPSTDRTIGRYVAVVTEFDDGTFQTYHTLGVGPGRYVSLGDSYSSGEGLPAFDLGTAKDVTPVPGELKERYPFDNACHRSKGSYGRLASQDKNLPVLLQPAEFHACSGAVARDFEKPNPLNEGEVAQLDHLNEFTDVVSLSVGGNDVGFSDVAVMCLALDCGLSLNPASVIGSNKWLSDAESMWEVTSYWGQRIFDIVEAGRSCAMIADGVDAFVCAYHAKKAIKSANELVNFDLERISLPSFAFKENATLHNRLTRIYRQVADHAPNARVFVQKYPYPVTDLTNNTSCEIAPFPAFSLSDAERIAIRKFIDEINDRIDSAVAAGNSDAGREQFEAIEPDTFNGHELCDGGELNPDTGINTIVNPFLGEPGTIGPVAYSLHPNRVGHEAYWEAFRAKLVRTFERAALALPGTSTTVGTLTVPPNQRWLNLTTFWKGSTVTATAISPSGKRFDVSSAGVRSDVTATTQWLDIPNPEAGQWTIEIYGDDVPEGGEDTIVRAWTSDKVSTRPTAAATTTVVDDAAGIVKLDGSPSTAGEGTIATYRWWLIDGTYVDGKTVTATIGAGGPRTLMLEVTNSKGDRAYADVAIPRMGSDNRAPTAPDLAFTGPEGDPIEVTLGGADPDGDPLTHVIVSQPSHGSLAGVAPNLVYVPNAGFSGKDTFTYSVSDGEFESASATVTITVTAPGSTTASISGVLTQGGVPSRGVQVRLFSVGGRTPLRYVVTDPNGKWKMDDLAPGDYEVLAVATSYRHVRSWFGPLGPRAGALKISVAAGEDKTDIRFDLKARS